MKKTWILLLILCGFAMAQRPYNNQRSGYAQNILWRDLHPSTQDSIRKAVSDSLAALSADGVTITNTSGTFSKKAYASTSDLASIAGTTGTTVFVAQTGESGKGAGTFVYKSSGYAADGGAIFSGSSGYWVRSEFLADTTTYKSEWYGANTNATIQNIVNNKMEKGDRLVLSGNYTGSISISTSNGCPDSITIDGIDPLKTTTSFIIVTNVQGLTLKNISINASDSYANGLSFEGDSLFQFFAKVENLRIYGKGIATTDHAILLSGGNIDIDGIYADSCYHVVAARARDVSIRNITGVDVVYSVTLKAGASDGDADNIIVENVTSEGSLSAPIFLQGETNRLSGVTINNIIAKEGSAALIVATETTGGIVENILISNAYGKNLTVSGVLNSGGELYLNNVVVDSAAEYGFFESGTSVKTYMSNCYAYNCGVAAFFGNLPKFYGNDSISVRYSPREMTNLINNSATTWVLDTIPSAGGTKKALWVASKTSDNFGAIELYPELTGTRKLVIEIYWWADSTSGSVGFGVQPGGAVNFGGSSDNGYSAAVYATTTVNATTKYVNITKLTLPSVNLVRDAKLFLRFRRDGDGSNTTDDLDDNVYIENITVRYAP